jgi:lipopolysaccharide export system protein LptA
MLTGEEPMHGQAEKMESAQRNRVIVYTGKVTLWQGANRIQGDQVTIDREKRVLTAKGNVVSHLWEKPKEDKPGGKAKAPPAGPPVLTIVRAANLVYSDQDRLAHYTGGVRLTRPGLDVKSRELRAWLAASGSDSSLERAEADGQVEILETSGKNRSRTGTGEHADYRVSDQKIILRGGEPLLVDSVKGRTRGSELTYFANDDRLLVNGVPERPATSVIRKR